MAIRVGFSCLLYQDDVTIARVSMLGLMRVKGAILRMIPGKKGASQSPMTNGQTQKPAPWACLRTAESWFGAYLLSHHWHANRCRAPCEHDRGQQLAGSGLCQPQVSRKLSNEIPNIEGTETCVPYRVTHV